MISVCMATYNGEKYVVEQLNSILVQLGSSDEVVVSDDGSSDMTIDLIRKIDDKRIKIVKNNGRHGFTPNFQNALANSSGEYIFLADQDDIWLPGKVEKTVSELQNYDCVISDCITVDEALNPISMSRFQDFKIRGTALEHLIRSRYIGCCTAFNRKVLEAALPFPTNYELLEHDIWIVAIAFAFFNVSLLREPLIMYRRHGSNVSDGGFKTGTSITRMAAKRFYRLVSLVRVGNERRCRCS